MAKTSNRYFQSQSGAAAGRPSTSNLDSGSTPTALSPLSPKTLHMIDDIRKPFGAFVEDFGTLTASRAALAPKFMKVFAAYASDSGGSFVQFCRVLDPKVPFDRDGYRAHPTYQAADYLRRLAVRDTTPAASIPESERPVTPLVALARLIATLKISDQVWTIFVENMHWSENQAKRLRKLAEHEGAISLAPRTLHKLRTGTDG